jgi:hypothetical protein
MDYVRGQPLDGCWEDLSEPSRLDITMQTAKMIMDMQSIEILQPGPISGGPCRGQFFTDYSAGSFESKSGLEDWFNHKLDICKKYNQAPADIRPFKFTDLAFTHQDITPRNLVLDQDGLV